MYFSGLLHSDLAEPTVWQLKVGISLGPPEMLQKPVHKKPSTTLGELENSDLLCQWAQRS